MNVVYCHSFCSLAEASVSSSDTPSKQSSPSPPPLPPRQAIVTAIYDCFPDHEDELAFKEGERIVVTKKHTLDWWVSLGGLS